MLLLSVSSNKGSKGKGVSARSDSLLLRYFLIGCAIGINLTRILTLVTYCLGIGTESATSIEFSRLLLEALSPRNDIEGIGYNLFKCCASNSYAVIALLRRLLRVLGRSKLLAYYTPEGVSSIRTGLGRILLI